MKYNHTIKEVKVMDEKFVDIYVYSGDDPISELAFDDVEWVDPECLAELPDELPCEFAEFDKMSYYLAEFDRVLNDGETVLVVVIPYVPAYDVYFDDDTSSNKKGWATTFAECMDYIRAYNGTDESYFADYKGGTVSIVCDETGETVYDEIVK